jgi:hypothetical protein
VEGSRRSLFEVHVVAETDELQITREISHDSHTLSSESGAGLPKSDPELLRTIFSVIILIFYAS